MRCRCTRNTRRGYERTMKTWWSDGLRKEVVSIRHLCIRLYSTMNTRSQPHRAFLSSRFIPLSRVEPTYSASSQHRPRPHPSPPATPPLPTLTLGPALHHTFP